ncbi:hypothetical protein PCLA_01f0780 [Pseudomonas citronellolis]|uniref:PilC/PilY family type IV pilus protein n=1 Tax=Pseudomonas citronellolis TaxID=53408 RepID=UPI000E2F9A7C|nr:PilC/PilY family type IV pilus protein [Pseudomonas citronellolis]GBL53622.1 hypothetical protein PCLA_01f0780 [Pseudomonas citronellolis]
MKTLRQTAINASASLLCALLLPCASAWADIDISRTPVFVNDSVPPLNMLVMGRDHKLYYEAYNDASDLNGDGILDVGYKGHLDKDHGGIDYYGYFNSFACYDYSDGRFSPVSATTNKKCPGHWSGDFLNYLATSRMDALRKVLYGGYRVEDTTTSTVLQGSYIPQDDHAWGKEYLSEAYDGYRISDYTPLSQPAAGGYRHLFAVVSLTQDTGVPQLRTLTNTSFRIWNWVSKERPVAGSTCVNSAGSEVNCTSGGPSGGNWTIVPADQMSGLTLTTWKDSRSTSTSKSQMDELFGSTYSNTSSRCGTGTAPFTNINSPQNFTNPYSANGCGQDSYHTLITGTLTPALSGVYQFSVDGDDAVEFQVNGVTASYYGDHGKSGSGGTGTTASVTLTAGTAYSFTFRHEENGGDANFYLYWKTPATGTSEMTDRNVKVSVCPSGTDNAGLRESNCIAYGNNFKPTGILHDYGATNKMYFGLLTGSFQKNISGGVLRSQLQSFSKEYSSTTGQYCFAGTNVCGSDGVSNGIVATINKLRIIDFNYGDHTYGCGWITTRPITQNDTCYMWGNPIGEMMYETMRYFSGETTPTSTYDYGSGNSKDKDVLGLPRIGTWTPPYKSTANPNGYPVCSVPAMTVISDINPSYDFKLPGSKWSTDVSAPSSGSLAGLNVSTEADKIWAAEGGGSKSIFIGESNGVADSAPTAKTVSNLSTVRGLAPEEPSKQGTYYSAAVARYGANNKIGGDKALLTYSVALASPLPTIKFPVTSNGVTSVVTVVPFAKSVGGSSIDANGSFQPTDQIVDYYVEKFANTSPACNGGTPSLVSDCDTTLNGGRPYAKFRINYEDVEQGADHDMDAIALYELLVNDQGKLVINMTSEYAAGGIDQHMGYVISGTTKDGIYLEVKDQGGNNVAYKLDTPDGRDPNYCNATTKPNDCTLSRLSSSRTFTLSGTPAATFLENPLWYAAKYGTNATNNDTDGNGVPDNYFLVTNALTLKDQLNKAFNDIYQRNSSVSTPSVERLQPGASISDARSVYRSNFLVDDWSGDLIKETINPATFARTVVWHAKDQFPSTRNIKFKGSNGSLAALTHSNLAGVTYNGVDLQTTLTSAQLGYVLGDRSGEGSSFRRRSTLLGDIINSNPVVVSGAQYLAYLAGAIDGGYQKYADFIEAKKTRRTQVYVGANDGMLHAFDGTTGAEKFAFVPRAVIPNLQYLSSKDYTAAQHRWFVDGSLTVRDVYYDDAWHTVLVGTLGAGGKSAFALDVTDPDNIALLWEFDDDNASSKDGTNTTLSNLGFTIPTPVVARLHSGQWGVLLPNGYNSANNSSGKAVMYVLNIKTGAVLKTLEAQGVAGTNGLSSIRGADNNSDGIIDYAYAGDLQGNLWRFDLIDSSATNPFANTDVQASTFKTSFNGTPLYVAKDADGSDGVRQPITAPPSLVRHPSTTGYLVIFGTGRYLGTVDKTGPFQLQTLYGIWDKKTKGEAATSTPSLSRASLQGQTISSQVNAVTFADNTANTFDIRLLSQNSVDWTTKSGWYLNLQVTGGSLVGERIVDEMAARGQALLINTRTPSLDVCQAGVEGWSYGLDPYTGGRADFNIFDFSQNFVVDQGDAYVSGDTSQVVSGYKTPAGGAALSGNTRFTADGAPMNISFGPESTGRQTWRVAPQ